MNFGRVPIDAKSPADFEKNVTVFSAGDQIALLKGSFGGWDPLDIPAGKYEYKVFVGDVLVAILPFEVR